MQIHFYIQFSSQPGEELKLRLFNKDFSKSVLFSMKYLNASYWDLVIEEDDLLTVTMVAYEVDLIRNGTWVKSLFSKRKFDLRKVHNDRVEIHDEITPDGYNGDIFESAVFRVLSQPVVKSAKKYADKNYTVAFNTFAPALPDGKVLCVLGSGNKLKNWDSNNPLLMYRKGNHWSIKLNLTADPSVEFKYAIYDTVAKQIVEWEAGDNRVLHTADINTMTVLHQYVRIPEQGWKGAGLAIPLFSIRSENDWGCGDFTQLKNFADWCAQSGFSMIQLLPLNDTTATRTRKDSYPYAPISAFALNPLFLDVADLAMDVGLSIPEKIQIAIDNARASKSVDYDKVAEIKWTVLRLVFDKVQHTYQQDYEWTAFFRSNQKWLTPYAVFSVFRDRNQTPNYNEWNEWAVFDSGKVTSISQPDSIYYLDISFYYFLQYHLHLQLRDAIEYANRLGVVIKGDLPVGVGRYSVDTWMYPQFFKFDFDYGAPPDGFSEEGQNWKFPVYDIEAMKADDFSWWKLRLQQMGNYFQAVRIDHVLGLLRMFCIPHQSGNPRLGRFYPIVPLTDSELTAAGLPEAKELLGQDDVDDNAILLKIEGGYHFRLGMQHTAKFKQYSKDWQYKLNNAYHQFFFEKQDTSWRTMGEEHFEVFKSASQMLLCAEDLGMNPTFLPELLEAFNILSLVIERMPSDIMKRYAQTKNSGYLSVVTSGTHDMETLRQWWETDRDNIQYYYNGVLGYNGLAPVHCTGSIVKDILRFYLSSPAMWVIFPVQDILAMNEGMRRSEWSEERINDPANPNQIWDYRLHLSIENLKAQKIFSEQIAQMIRESGR